MMANLNIKITKALTRIKNKKSQMAMLVICTLNLNKNQIEQYKMMI